MANTIYTGNGRRIEVLNENNGIIEFELEYQDKKVVKKLTTFSFNMYLEKIGAKKEEATIEIDDILEGIEKLEKETKNDKKINTTLINANKLFNKECKLKNGGTAYIFFIEPKNDKDINIYIGEDKNSSYKIINFKEFANIVDPDWLDSYAEAKFSGDSIEDIKKELDLYFA